MAASKDERLAPRFIALLPGLDDQQGHQYDYGRAVQAAVGLAGWPYQAAVPLGCRIDPLPSGWTRALDRGQYHFTGNVLTKAQSVRQLAGSIARYLRAARPGGERAIVFVEFFNYVQLAALVLALGRVPCNRLAVWLLYRLPVQASRTRWIYQALHTALRRLVGKSNLVLLTDAAPLVEPLQRLFGQTLTVMPIPHARPDEGEAAVTPAWTGPRPRYVAWWPGRAAVDKGLERLRRMAAEATPAAGRWGLAATDEAGLRADTGGPAVRALPAALPRAEYWGWMQAADLIVLPYLAEWYHARTSGIFVEAIAAGKPAAVSAGTWMAAEALAHDLPELIVAWDQAGVWERLTQLVEDQAIRPKLNAMAEQYRQRHTPAGFAQVMQQIAR